MKKVNLQRYFINYIFFCVAFSFFELILRISTSRQFDLIGFLFSVLFNMIVAVLFCSIMVFIKRKAHIITSNIFLSLIAGLYISQIIYFNVFGTFYNTESMFNAGQITQFWVVILRSLWERAVYILLCIITVPIYNLFIKKKIFSSDSTEKTPEKSNRKDEDWQTQLKQITVGISATVYILMFTAFVPFAAEPFSQYSIFFGQQDYESSIKRTGLLSTLQTDVIKLFVTENSSGALHTLDELRNTEQSDQTVNRPQPDSSEQSTENTDNTNASTVLNTGTDSSDNETPDEEIPPEPIEYGYNIMDIDFTTLAENESRSSVRSLHEYFSRSVPSQKNEYTGMFEGYNLIMFVAEAFSPFAVREDLTPTLYKLVHEGFYFSEFYTPSWRVSTSDGEYVACTGLLPKSGVWSFYRSRNNYMPFAMGNQLRNLGYTTVAYHNHTHTYYRRHLSHPNMGYEFKGIGDGLILPNNLWPNSDLEMMQVTIDEYINNQPFHAYYMTVSGHLEYNFGGNAMSRRNRDLVEHLPYSDANKAYIACNIELDKALEYLMKRLNDAGIAENTFIVLSTDHYPYGLDGTNGISEFLGHQVDPNFEIYKNHLIIYAQGMTPVTIDKPSSSLDIIPTVSNLMGLEFDSRLFPGRDILSNSDPLVIFVDRSFITGNGRRIRGGDFIPNPGVTVDDDYGDFMRAVVEAKFSVSTSILDLDYFRIIFE